MKKKLDIKYEIENMISNNIYNINDEEQLKKKLEIIKFINNDETKIKILYELELYNYYINILKDERINKYKNIVLVNDMCPCCLNENNVYKNYFCCNHCICDGCYKLWTAKTCPTCRSL